MGFDVWGLDTKKFSRLVLYNFEDILTGGISYGL